MRTSRVTRSLIAIALGVLAPAAAVEIPFAPEVDLTTVLDGAVDVVVADIDGDETPDYVVCGENSATVRVYMPIASGAYFSATIASGLDSPYTLAVGDIDGDGDADVLVGQYNNIPIDADPTPDEAELLWLENPRIGGGSWTMHDLDGYSVYDGARQVALGDLDGDGDLDVAAVMAGTYGQAKWIENDGSPGDGGWSYHSIDSDVADPWGIALADLDRDGDLDAVVSDRSTDTVAWYENDGGPTDYWTRHQIAAGLTNPIGVAVADMDDDGRPDVVVSETGANAITWYEGSGASWSGTPVSATFGGAWLHLTDLDRDGDLDVLACDESAGDVVWFENSGNGASFTQRAVDVDFLGANRAVAGDFDDDGDPEVLAVGFAGDSFSWWENETVHRGFSAASGYDLRTGLGDPRALDVGDVNGDGLLDVVAAMWSTDTITVYLGFSSTGTSWFERTVTTTFDGARDVALADVDGDGDLDVLGAGIYEDAFRWWENDGGALPSWTERTILTANGAHRIEPLDYDRDGDVDVVTASFDSDEVTLMENANGSGTSWTPHALTPPYLDGAFDLAVGDLDGDGWPDIVASGYNENAIRYYINGAGGLWAFSSVATSVTGPRGIDLGDIDHDGDLDVVAVIRTDNHILWFENDLGGAGWTQHNVGTGTFVDGSAVTACDLDGDGDVDVAATSQSSDDVKVWLNGGHGSTWETPVLVDSSIDSPWEIATGDIDDDGKPDLIVAAGGSVDSLTWYRNVGGQARFWGLGYNPGDIADGEAEPVMLFSLEHRGRSGWDPPAELASIDLRFTDADGAPLTTAQVNLVIDRVQIVQDTDRDLAYEPGTDAVVVTDSYLSLIDGVETTTVNDGALPARIPAEDYYPYFVVVQATADASAQALNRLRVTLLTAGLVVQDQEHDIVLDLEPAADPSSSLFDLGPLFSDDFESAGTGAWSDATP